MFAKLLITFILVSILLSSSKYVYAEQTLTIGQRERLLVLAPHPDDETLSAAGLILKVFENGGTVRTTVITAGDAYVEAIKKATGKRKLSKTDFLNYGEQRLEESRRAARLLGKGFIHLDLFGFSDGAIYPMLVSHWGYKHPDKSEFTGYSHVPYVEAEDKGVAQNGMVLRNQLLEILKSTKPTLIVFPDVMENDSDHAGLGMFALLVINEWIEQSHNTVNPRLLAYLIHWQHGWPAGSETKMPIDLSTTSLFLPNDLPLRGMSRTCNNLTPQEIELKRLALAEYKTQQRAMGSFLAAFVRNNECFSALKLQDTVGIYNVVKQWQHVRKTFDSHPISRKNIR